MLRKLASAIVTSHAVYLFILVFLDHADKDVRNINKFLIIYGILYISHIKAGIKFLNLFFEIDQNVHLIFQEVP